MTPSGATTPAARNAVPKGGVVWTPAAVLARVLAVWVLAAGCAPGLAAIKQGVEAESEIFVVYGEGTVVTRVARRTGARTRTPQDYRAIVETVRETLARHMRGHRVVAAAGQAGLLREAGGLEAVVTVHGGYVCNGERATYRCGLTVQSRITFRSLRTGRLVGPWGNLIGQVWYGTHPLTLPDGEAGGAGGAARLAAVDEAIRKELPAAGLLGPLESATEEGLAAFLEDVLASGG